MKALAQVGFEWSVLAAEVTFISAASDDKVLVIEANVQVCGAGTLVIYRSL